MDFCLPFLNRLFTDCLFCKGLQLICPVAVHVLAAIKRNLLKALWVRSSCFCGTTFSFMGGERDVIDVRQISGDSLALRLV